jgi:hypothetical protein
MSIGMPDHASQSFAFHAVLAFPSVLMKTSLSFVGWENIEREMKWRWPVTAQHRALNVE